MKVFILIMLLGFSKSSFSTEINYNSYISISYWEDDCERPKPITLFVQKNAKPTSMVMPMVPIIHVFKLGNKEIDSLESYINYFEKKIMIMTGLPSAYSIEICRSKHITKTIKIYSKEQRTEFRRGILAILSYFRVQKSDYDSIENSLRLYKDCYVK